LTENAGLEIGEQDIISFENRLHYNAVCNSFLKQQHNTSHNSKLSCIICIYVQYVEMHKIL